MRHTSFSSASLSPPHTALRHFLLAHCGYIPSQEDFICQILTLIHLIFKDRTELQQISWIGIAQPPAQSRILFTPPEKPSDGLPSPMLPWGLPGDILFSVSVVMCFFQQFLPHEAVPRISPLWPLQGQCFRLLSFPVKGRKDCAKG